MLQRPNQTPYSQGTAQRRDTISAAVILGFFALLLSFSLGASLWGSSSWFAIPGSFLLLSYGMLAFLIPAYLLCAAAILFMPSYRPDRIFSLTCSIIPFLTLAATLSILRDFEVLREDHPLLRNLGTYGFAILALGVAAIEILAIIALTILIFPYPRKETEYRQESEYRKMSGKPSTVSRDRAGKPLLMPPRPKLTDVYVGAAANTQGTEREPKTSMQLPALRPLKSLRVEPQPLSSEAMDAGQAVGSVAVDPEPFFEAIPEDPAMFPEAVPADQGPVHGAVPVYAEQPGDTAQAGREQLAETARAVRTEAAGRDQLQPEAKPEARTPDQLQMEAQPEMQRIHEVDPDLERALSDAEKEARRKSEEVLHKESSGGAIPASEAASHHGTHGRPPKGEYHVPVEGILTAYPDGEYWIIDQATRDAAVILKETLKEFNIQAEVTGIRKGPVITMFEILPAPGVKLSKIVNLQDNIALRLAASSVRIVAPIPGKHAVGIEVPNHKRNIVSFREMIEGQLHREGKRLEIPVILGKDITGEAQTVDLVQTPHLLIAGATGSGKSVCVNAMILSILYQRSPAECRLILIDPKIVELKLYNDIPHLLTPVITEPKRAFQALQYCIFEMERRYALLDSMGVRDIRSYNKRIKERNVAAERIPYIVVVIDEFADLMATTGKELESTVARLAAMSRAIGIHLVLATQRPSIDVITGLIKANIPSRIAFMVASKMDSRIIIDMVGAEKLLGKGDMLYAGVVDPFPVRMQGAFVSEEEVEKVVEYVKTLGEPDYLDEEIFYDDEDEAADPSLFSDGDDPLYEKALEIVHQQGKASASYIQRRLKVGYNRAARLVEEMEQRGIVGPAQGSKPRDLLRGSS